jgi:hypothetical protein
MCESSRFLRRAMQHPVRSLTSRACVRTYDYDMTSPFAPSATSYLDGADHYIEAACLLCDAARSVEPIGLLASHGVELALKAFLLHCQVPEKELRTIGHDLAELWMRARARGLEIERGPPYWVRVLAFAHGTAYHLYRYPPERIASAIPDAPELKQELANFLRVVTTAVGR